MEALLQDETENARAVFFADLAKSAGADESDTVDRSSPAPDPGMDEEKFSALAKDPGIAAVLDEFKGTIVDVRQTPDSPK